MIAIFESEFVVQDNEGEMSFLQGGRVDGYKVGDLLASYCWPMKGVSKLYSKEGRGIVFIAGVYDEFMVGLLSLTDLGWSEQYAVQVVEDRDLKLQPARVVAVHKGACDVSNGERVRPAKMTGRLRHRAKSRSDYPTVGDWVLVKNFSIGEFGRVERVLERDSVLRRKSAGRTSHEQLIAANLDRVFIVQSMDAGFSLKRIERYLVMVNESGIEPIIILTKRDLLEADACIEVEELVKNHLPGVRVLLMSNETGEGLGAALELFRAKINVLCDWSFWSRKINVAESGFGRRSLVYVAGS